LSLTPSAHPVDAGQCWWLVLERMRYRQLNGIVSCVDNIHDDSLFVGVAVEREYIANAKHFNIRIVGCHFSYP
ncbi:hypothetical protein, partial [Xenorhabdus bovienii]|uniref:hypothetical protein n=1 Tax=Xenorhabdus bovienii TaxID=40576 RepID=UPI0023B276E8